MALQGLAKVLLGGFNEIDRRKQMQMQEQLQSLQLEGMGLRNEALRRQLDAPPPSPPSGLDLGVFVPDLAGVQIDPQYVDDVLRAYGSLQPQPKDTIDLGMQAAWNQAVATGDYSSFFDRYPNAEIPASALAAFTQTPSRSLDTMAGYARHAQDFQPIGEELAGIISAQTGLSFNPQATPAALRSILGDNWVDQYIRLAAAPGERERTDAQTDLDRVRAFVLRDDHDWSQIMDEREMDLKTRAFLASEEGRLWQQGFDERKQSFFEYITQQKLSNEEAAQAFDEFIAREKLALQDRVVSLDEQEFAHRLDRDTESDRRWEAEFAYTQERDRESDRRWEAEHDLRVSAQEFDQKMRTAQHDWTKEYQTIMADLTARGLDIQEIQNAFNRYMQTRQQEHREAVDQGRMTMEQARLAMDRDAQEFHQRMVAREQERKDELHPYAVQSADAEARMANQLATSGTVSLGDLATSAGVDPTSWPESVRQAPVQVGDGRGLSAAISNLRQSDPNALRHLPLALHIYDTSYGGLTGIVEGAPTFTEFFQGEFQHLVGVAEAIASGQIPPQEIQEMLPEIEEALAPEGKRQGISLPRQSLLAQMIDYFLSGQPIRDVENRIGAVKDFRDTTLSNWGESLERYASGTPSITESPILGRDRSVISNDRSAYYGDLDRVLDEILAYSSPEEELQVLRQATPEERQEYEDYYGVPFDRILLGIMLRSVQ